MRHVLPALGLLLTLTSFAQAGYLDLGKPATRNALPSETEEMQQRELCARRNMDRNGTVHGDCQPSPLKTPKAKQQTQAKPPKCTVTTNFDCCLHAGFSRKDCTFIHSK